MRVRVGPHTYTVSVKRDMSEHGLTFVEDCNIFVSDTLGPSMVREVMLHELLHAIWSLTGLDKEMDSTDMEERAIRRLAPALLALLRDNPTLTAKLLKKED